MSLRFPESVDDADDDGGFLSDADSLKDVALSESFKGMIDFI